MTHGAEFNVVDEYTVLGSNRSEWKASNVTITSADLRKGIIDVTVTNNTDVELTVKLGEELAFARGPLGTTAQAREAPRAPLILRARCTTWSPLTRSWTTPTPSTTTRSPDASRTSPPCHDSTGRWTSSLFIRSEFVKKMNEQNRTAWLWSYESQKRSEHKLVTYAATTSAKNQPSIVGQWGGCITVNIRQPGDDADHFVEILVTAFIITGTSPGPDMLAGCRWLGEKGLILLPTVKANKIKTEVLLQYDALIDDTLPQVVLDYFCNPDKAPANFKISETYRSKLASAVSRQQSFTVATARPVANDGAAAMEVEQQPKQVYHSDLDPLPGYDEQLVATVSHLIQGFDGDLNRVASALASAAKIPAEEAHRRVSSGRAPDRAGN